MECQKHPACPVSKSYTALLPGALPLHPATRSRPQVSTHDLSTQATQLFSSHLLPRGAAF